MSIWSSLFGSDKVIDAGINGIDAMVFTDEEKSSAKMKFLSLYEPFKIGQRYLAMTFCPVYVLVWFITVMIEVANVFTVKAYNTDKLFNMLQGDMGLMVALIMGFYFGGGAVEGVINRMSKNKQ